MPGWLWGLVAAGALWLIARGGPSSSAIVARSPVALVGDSIAVGLSSPMASLMREQGVAFFADAEVGTNARQWRSRIDRVLARAPGTVIVNLGGNDAASATLTGEFAPNMRAIVDKIRAAGAVSVLLEPPNRPSPSFLIIQQGLRAAGADALIIPAPGLPRAPDGVHFTTAGYREWAEDVVEVLT